MNAIENGVMLDLNLKAYTFLIHTVHGELINKKIADPGDCECRLQLQRNRKPLDAVYSKSPLGVTFSCHAVTRYISD
jgi:hypothetical protein